MEPCLIKEYKIYDIFHNGNIIIISPYSAPLLEVSYQGKPFNLNECPDKNARIYFLEAKYNNTIELIINGSSILTRVNKYPEFENEIIFSTLVKNEEPYIKQWIEYYLNLGVTRFIIYDNSSSSELLEILKEYIENKCVVLIKWTYTFHDNAQTTQQNHSIYAFHNSKYIGLFDIDEYINIQTPDKKIDVFLNSIIQSHKIDCNEISGFMLYNKFFYNPFRLKTEGTSFFNIFNCDEISEEGFEKCIVIPKNIKTFSVHVVTDGLPLVLLDKSYVYFNHYYFLNKENRGLDKTDLLDNSILLSLQLNP